MKLSIGLNINAGKSGRTQFSTHAERTKGFDRAKSLDIDFSERTIDVFERSLDIDVFGHECTKLQNLSARIFIWNAQMSVHM